MVLLLGASGYVAHAFAGELRRCGHCFIPLTRRAIDYTNFELLFDYVRRMGEMIQAILKPDHEFEFWKDDDEFYRHAARAPRSNCVLEITKLLGAGVEMRPVEEALEDSLRNWQCVTPPLQLVLH